MRVDANLKYECGACRVAGRQSGLIRVPLVAAATVVTLASWVAPASAQIDRPRLLNTPLAPYVAGNTDRFVIAPSLQLDHETNAFPFGVANVSGVVDNKGKRANTRVTPGVDVALSKPVGRIHFTLDSRVGYDFNTAYSRYNNVRASANGSAAMQVAGVCNISAHGTYQQFRLDQTDLAANITATAREQGYDLSASCSRLSGFSPVLGASYVKETAGVLSFYAYHAFSERGGVSYSKPSLGTLSLVASFQQFRRPGLVSGLSEQNGTDVKQINLELSRAVAPHLQLRAGVGYYTADPQRLGLKSTTGPAYDADLRILLSSRTSLDLAVRRDITNDNGTDASYSKRQDYIVTGNYRLTGKSSIYVTGEYTQRSLKGETLVDNILPVNSDQLKRASLNYFIDVFKNLRLTTAVRHDWRTSAQRVYDYQNTAFTASIGARF